MEKSDEDRFGMIFILFCITGTLTILLLVIYNVYDASRYDGGDSGAVAAGTLFCSLLIMPLIIATFLTAIYAYKRNYAHVRGNALILLALSFFLLILMISTASDNRNNDDTKVAIILVMIVMNLLAAIAAILMTRGIIAKENKPVAMIMRSPQTRICGKCGNEVNIGVNFCGQCGSEFPK